MALAPCSARTRSAKDDVMFDQSDVCFDMSRPQNDVIEEDTEDNVLLIKTFEK